MRRFTSLLVVVAALAVGQDASAAEPNGSLAERTTREWYGWQTLAADVPGVLAMSAGAASSGRPLAPVLGYGGMALYALAPPIVHLVHRRPGTAAVDLALRTATPLVGIGIGFVVGAFTANAGDLFDVLLRPVEGATYGMAIGAATAIAIDAAVLAREEVPAPKPRALTWSPTFARLGTGATVGVTGRF